MSRSQLTNRPAHYNKKYKDDLTPREKEVLSLVSKGKTNAEIAQHLGLAFETVKWHMSGVLEKLGVDSREEAAAYWRSRGGRGGRLDRGWNAFIGIFAGKAAMIAGAPAVLVAAAAIAAIAIALALNGGDSRERLETAPAGAEWRVSQPVARVPYPQPFGEQLIAGGALWYATWQGVVRVDLDTHEVTAILETDLGDRSNGHNVAFAGGHVWTVAGDWRGLIGLDPATGKAVRRIDFEFQESRQIWLLGTDDKLYISAPEAGLLIRLDLATGKADGELQLDKSSGSWGPPVMAAGSLWILLTYPGELRDTGEVVRVDPTTMQTLAVTAASGEQKLVAANDSIWAIRHRENLEWDNGGPGGGGFTRAVVSTVGKIDIATNSVVDAALRVERTHFGSWSGRGSGGMDAFAMALSVDRDGDLWAAGIRDGQAQYELVRVDGATGQIVEAIPFGVLTPGLPISVIADGDTLWVLTVQGDVVPVRRKP